LPLALLLHAAPSSALLLSACRTWASNAPCRPLRPIAPLMAQSDRELEIMVQEELDRAFAGLEAGGFNPDEEEALKMIEDKAATVLQNVLQQLEQDGEVLRDELSQRLEAVAEQRRDEMFAKYEESTAGITREVAASRATIREEMERLTSLNSEYKALKNSSPVNRDGIVGGVAFLVGLTYVSNAINELLRLGLGAVEGDTSETIFNLVVDSVLGVAGIVVYFSKQRSGEP